jgi:hypothetical protein
MTPPRILLSAAVASCLFLGAPAPLPRQPEAETLALRPAVTVDLKIRSAWAEGVWPEKVAEVEAACPALCRETLKVHFPLWFSDLIQGPGQAVLHCVALETPTAPKVIIFQLLAGDDPSPIAAGEWMRPGDAESGARLPPLADAPREIAKKLVENLFLRNREQVDAHLRRIPLASGGEWHDQDGAVKPLLILPLSRKDFGELRKSSFRVVAALKSDGTRATLAVRGLEEFRLFDRHDGTDPYLALLTVVESIEILGAKRDLRMEERSELKLGNVLLDHHEPPTELEIGDGT